MTELLSPPCCCEDLLAHPWPEFCAGPLGRGHDGQQFIVAEPDAVDVAAGIGALGAPGARHAARLAPTESLRKVLTAADLYDYSKSHKEATEGDKMNATQIATVETGTRVQYEDMSNPLRVGVVFEIDETPWGTQYAVRFDGGDIREWDADRVVTTDLRQQGWKFERVLV